MSIKELQNESYRLGRRAFEKGIKAIAVLDPDVMKLINRHDAPRESASIMLKAWARGWHTAKLGAAA